MQAFECRPRSRCCRHVLLPTTSTPAAACKSHMSSVQTPGAHDSACPLLHTLQGVLQRAPAELAPGEDFAQALCFSEEAMQEAAAAARRRGAAATCPAPGRQGGGSGAAAAAAGGGSGAAAAAAGGGTVPGALLGVEGIEEWCEQQERVVLFNNGEFVKPPPECSMPPSARPATALVAA